MECNRIIGMGLVLLSLLLCVSCSASPGSIRAGGWQFLIAGEESIETIAARTDWQPIMDISMPTAPGGASKGLRVVWLKGVFLLQGDPGRYRGLSLPRIGHGDRVFLNRTLIGETRTDELGHFSVPRSYPILGARLQQGRNEVYIRLETQRDNPASIIRDVLIQPESDYSRTRIRNDLLNRQFPMAILIMCALMAFTLFAAYLIWHDKLFLYNAVGLVLVFIHVMSVFLPSSVLSPALAFSIRSATIPVFALWFVLAIQALYGVYLSQYNRIIVPAAVVTTLLILICSISPWYLQINRGLVLMTRLVILPCGAYLIYRLHGLRADRFRLHMIMVIAVILLAAAATDSVVEMMGWGAADLIAVYSSLLFFPIFTLFTLREHMKARMEVEALYGKLKSSAAKEQTITDSSEEKLKRVIDFIRENITSDISRDELAEAIDMNPNYMGSLFKAYTGQTINDYINQLRIEMAVKALQESDDKILSIALNVGFNSLATFNRVFKQITGKTPSQYRGTEQ